MRAYFRVAPHFGASVPWWLALPLVMLWGAAAAAFWLFYAFGYIIVLSLLGIRWCWRNCVQAVEDW